MMLFSLLNSPKIADDIVSMRHAKVASSQSWEHPENKGPEKRISAPQS